MGPGLGEMVIVQELNSQTQIKLRPGLVLDWYEGLLVIESLVRSSEPCEWLNQVSDIFQKEKSQRTLSSSLYVSKKLMDAAVTGPQFVTREAWSCGFCGFAFVIRVIYAFGCGLQELHSAYRIPCPREPRLLIVATLFEVIVQWPKPRVFFRLVGTRWAIEADICNFRSLESCY